MKEYSGFSIQVESVSKKFSYGGKSAMTIRDKLSNIWTTRNKDEFWALRDVSFTINRGEVFGVIGNNGAGKSTLLKIISGISLPDQGVVKRIGRVASLLEVGTGFHPELTGRENIYLNASILGMRRRDIANRLDQIIDFSELEKFIDMPVKKYSSGMYVRLAFAVAAHVDCEILIIDEVLAVGDYKFRQKCLSVMDDYGKNGDKSILFASHNMSYVRAHCSRALLLDEGKLSFIGSAQECIDRYIIPTNEAVQQKPKIQRSFVLNSLRIRNTSENSERLSSGCDMKIELKYSILKGLAHARIKIELLNNKFEPIAMLNSNLVSDQFNLAKYNTVVISLSSIPLNVNTYYAIIRVLSYDGCEYESSPVRLVIRAGDYYSSKMLPNNKYPLLLKYNYSLT